MPLVGSSKEPGIASYTSDPAGVGHRYGRGRSRPGLVRIPQVGKTSSQGAPVFAVQLLRWTAVKTRLGTIDMRRSLRMHRRMSTSSVLVVVLHL